MNIIYGRQRLFKDAKAQIIGGHFANCTEKSLRKNYRKINQKNITST